MVLLPGTYGQTWGLKWKKRKPFVAMLEKVVFGATFATSIDKKIIKQKQQMELGDLQVQKLTNTLNCETSPNPCFEHTLSLQDPVCALTWSRWEQNQLTSIATGVRQFVLHMTHGTSSRLIWLTSFLCSSHASSASFSDSWNTHGSRDDPHLLSF